MKPQKEIKLAIKKDSHNGLHLSITCPYCGKPINKTSVKWGMDCENDCS